MNLSLDNKVSQANQVAPDHMYCPKPALTRTLGPPLPSSLPTLPVNPSLTSRVKSLHSVFF